MDAKTKTLLEQAKAYHHEWRLQEAYGILRRFFDRLPFRPEQEHAEYIGIFVRILVELGKEHELKFYMNELAQLYDRCKDPALGYQLGVVYVHSSEPRPKAAKQIFQSIVVDPAAISFHVRAKIMLVFLHCEAEDFVACRRILDTIEDPKDDPNLRRVVRIWRANISRREKKFDEADAILQTVFQDCDFKTDWYSFLSAKICEAKIAHDSGNTDRTSIVLGELQRLLAKRRCRSIQGQVDSMQKQLRDRDSFEPLLFLEEDDKYTLTYENRTLVLTGNTAMEKLLLLLLKKKFVNKENIVKRIYARNYDSERDDKLIYYQIHSLRKRLGEIGLPSEAIRSKGNGYRLVPAVEILGEAS